MDIHKIRQRWNRPAGGPNCYLFTSPPSLRQAQGRLFSLRGGRDNGDGRVTGYRAESRRALGEGYPPCETKRLEISVSFRFICFISSDFVAGGLCSWLQMGRIRVGCATESTVGLHGCHTGVSREVGGEPSVVKLRAGVGERNSSTDVRRSQ